MMDLMLMLSNQCARCEWMDGGGRGAQAGACAIRAKFPKNAREDHFQPLLGSHRLTSRRSNEVGTRVITFK